MAFVTKLLIDGKEIEVISYRFGFKKQVNEQSRPTSLASFNGLEIKIESTENTDFEEWINSETSKDKIELQIFYPYLEGGSKIMTFYDCYLVGFQTIFSNNNNEPIKDRLRITSGGVKAPYSEIEYTTSWRKTFETKEKQTTLKNQKTTKTVETKKNQITLKNQKTSITQNEKLTNLTNISMPLPPSSVPWRFFWIVVSKRFAAKGVLAATLAAADGPLPIGDLIALGLSIWTIYEIIKIWDELWEEAQDDANRCLEVKNECIKKCSEESLPTGVKNGFPFWNCVNECMKQNQCL